MRYRLLGNSGLRASQLFLGAITFAEGFVHGAGVDEARRIMDTYTYTDAGANVINTASNYRDGASEEIAGEVLDGRRDRFVVATKYGVSRDPLIPTRLAGRCRTSCERSSYVSCHQHTTRDTE